MEEGIIYLNLTNTKQYSDMPLYELMISSESSSQLKNDLEIF